MFKTSTVRLVEVRRKRRQRETPYVETRGSKKSLSCQLRRTPLLSNFLTPHATITTQLNVNYMPLKKASPFVADELPCSPVKEYTSLSEADKLPLHGEVSKVQPLTSISQELLTSNTCAWTDDCTDAEMSYLLERTKISV